MQQKGQTQEQLSEMSEVNATYLSALERGQKNVTIEILDKVASALQVDLYQLFFFESDSELPTKAELSRLINSLDASKVKQLLELLKIVNQ